MEIEAWAANGMAQYAADQMTGGYVDVFDIDDKHLARCAFAAQAFAPPDDGAVAAHPFPPAIALADGKPAHFTAHAAGGEKVLTGSAGYKDAEPKPEMVFKTRQILEGADVMIESFVFSVVRKSESEGGR